MMSLYTERAGLEDGMEVLDLGCGWGSMTLFLAEKFANMKVTGLVIRKRRGSGLRVKRGGRVDECEGHYGGCGGV